MIVFMGEESFFHGQRTSSSLVPKFLLGNAVLEGSASINGYNGTLYNFNNRHILMLNMVELHSLPALDKLKLIEALCAELANDENSIPNLT